MKAGLDNNDMKEYMEAWALMMITIWRDRIRKLRIQCTDKLFNSFKYEVVTVANGDITKINHAFKYYGVYVDMGVGRGVKYDDHADGFAGNRRAKKWWLYQYRDSEEVLRYKIFEIYGEVFKGSVTAILES